MSKTTNKFSPEVRARALRVVDEHRADYGSEWSAMTSIGGKIGYTAETLRRCSSDRPASTTPYTSLHDSTAGERGWHTNVRTIGHPLCAQCADCPNQ